MKKHLLTATFALLTCSLFAQIQLLKSIDEVELMVGPSIEVLRGRENSEDNVVKVGYAAYGGVSWNISNKIGIKLRVGYHRKGQNREAQVSYWNSDSQEEIQTIFFSKRNLDYLVVPISFVYKPFDRQLPLCLEGGVFISSLRRAQTIGVYSDGGRPKETFDVMSDHEKGDWGMVLGIDYQIISLSQLNLLFAVFYQFGFFDVSTAPSYTTYHNLKTSSLFFSVKISTKRKSKNNKVL